MPQGDPQQQDDQKKKCQEDSIGIHVVVTAFLLNLSLSFTV